MVEIGLGSYASWVLAYCLMGIAIYISHKKEMAK